MRPTGTFQSVTVGSQTEKVRIKDMAHLLAASSCDLGDESDVLRTLRAAGNEIDDVVAYSDRAI